MIGMLSNPLLIWNLFLPFIIKTFFIEFEFFISVFITSKQSSSVSSSLWSPSKRLFIVFNDGDIRSRLFVMKKRTIKRWKRGYYYFHWCEYTSEHDHDKPINNFRCYSSILKTFFLEPKYLQLAFGHKILIQFCCVDMVHH